MYVKKLTPGEAAAGQCKRFGTGRFPRLAILLIASCFASLSWLFVLALVAVTIGTAPGPLIVTGLAFLVAMLVFATLVIVTSSRL